MEIGAHHVTSTSINIFPKLTQEELKNYTSTSVALSIYSGWTLIAGQIIRAVEWQMAVHTNNEFSSDGSLWSNAAVNAICGYCGAKDGASKYEIIDFGAELYACGCCSERTMNSRYP